MAWYPKKYSERHKNIVPFKAIKGFKRAWRYSEQLQRSILRKRATPKWITRAQRQDMLRFYQYARKLTRETGIEYTVDHIEPLLNKKFLGLHVPWNLRVITALDNRIKKNNQVKDYISPWCVFPTPIQ